MNVWFFLDYAPSYSGNLIPCLAALASRLRARGDSVSALFPSRAAGMDWLHSLDDIEVRYCDFNCRDLYEFSRKLKASEGRELIVHAHFLSPVQLAAVRCVFPRVVHHYHMTLPEKYGFDRLAKDGFRAVVFRCCTNIAVSPAVANAMKARLCLPSGSIACIPNAVDFSAPRIAVSRQEEVFKTEGDGRFTVGMFGTDFNRKGVDIAFDAIKMLGDDYHLLVLAYNVKFTYDCLQASGLEGSHVTVLSVVENVGTFFESIDLFISPSREEAFCYAVVEAAWSNCQVAASLVAGQDFLQSIPGSIWFEPNSTALTHAILEARNRTSDPAMLGNLNRKQRNFCEANYSVSSWCDKILSIYDGFSNGAS